MKLFSPLLYYCEHYRISWYDCVTEMFSSLGDDCISISMKDATWKPQKNVKKLFSLNTVLRMTKSYVKAANIEFATSRTHSAWRTSLCCRSYTKIVFRISILCTLNIVIFSKNSLCFVIIHKNDYDAWNPYLASERKLHPNVYERQCSLDCSTSADALYRDMRHSRVA
jgi:hypothetical protein